MSLKKLSDNGSIVLIGSFNPQIFQPFWFSHNNLVQSTEAEAVHLDVIAMDITSFRFPWLNVQVFREKFLAITTDESQFLPLRDFVIGTFQLLGHTPVRQMGINRDIQFEMASEKDWHQIGHNLAPKQLWKKYLKKPGLKSLVINGEREDGYNGEINVSVRPILEKKAIENKNVVEVSYNSHFNFEMNSSAKDVLGIIMEKFEPTQKNAFALSESLIKECIKEQK